MILTNAGNVGIGTDFPSGALVVMNGNVGIGTWVPQDLLLLVHGAGPAWGTPLFDLLDTANHNDIVDFIAPNSNTPYFVFGTAKSPQNASTMGFNWVGNGSTSNSVTFNLYGDGSALSVYGNYGSAFGAYAANNVLAPANGVIISGNVGNLYDNSC